MIEAKGHLDGSFDRDRLAILGCGGKLPVLNGFDSGRIKRGAKRAKNRDVARHAVGANNKI
jgi:hypothetical protein